MSHVEAQALPAIGAETKASLADNCQSFANYPSGTNDPNSGLLTSSPPTLSHMDMVRPPHEGYYCHLTLVPVSSSITFLPGDVKINLSCSNCKCS